MSTENLSFEAHIAACEYMNEENSKLVAWTEGPHIGMFRIAYVNAHKAHAEALKIGEIESINRAWGAYCEAQNSYVDALYGNI